MENSPNLSLISLVIPAYNEEKNIQDAVVTSHKLLSKQHPNFEIIIVNDGSTDSTYAIAKKLEEQLTNVRVLSFPKNRGRGASITSAFATTTGQILAYIDADMSISPTIIPDLIRAISNNADIAVMSKHHPLSKIDYSAFRALLSRSYSFLARRLLGTNIRDYQGGAKAFKKSVYTALSPNIKNERWFWDTEILTNALWSGYSVVEVPGVICERSSGSKVHVIIDSVSMGVSLLSLALERLYSILSKKYLYR